MTLANNLNFLKMCSDEIQMINSGNILIFYMSLEPLITASNVESMRVILMRCN